MYLRNVATALLGLSAMASAAPAPLSYDTTPSEMGLKHRSKAQKRSPLIIQQTIIEPQITIVEQNLGALNQLAQIAEQEFAALVQSQIALVTQLETIKNNIRVNHFKAKFTSVNTVIVTVTNIIDTRDSKNVNKRYLMNQLLADNGKADQQIVVMVTQKEAITIGATPTLDISGILGAAASASAVSLPTGSPGIAAFDPTAPFGQLNTSLILPYNTSAPANAIILEDPADIIFADQTSLFVESAQNFQSDCAQFGSSATSLLDLALVQLFPSVADAFLAQIAGLSLGTALPIIPPSVLTNNPALAAQAQASAAASSSSTTSVASSTTATQPAIPTLTAIAG